ncbi:MAG: type II toxin-antitoxin system PemK/MazF family toxin [Parachlamydia sp.]|nr:type II toxin-antitoxin system PemK/MazF family toxin [Parachlamydia sp.]
MVKRFEVYLVSLDSTIGREIKKTRPCVVISPDEMNGLNTSIVAPMTTKCRSFPTRIPVTFDNKNGFIVLDQIRTVDHARFVQLLGTIDKKSALDTLKVLREMFER